MRRQPLLLRQSLKFSSLLLRRHPAQHHRDPVVGRAMVEDGVTGGEIIRAIAIRPIPAHAVTATIAIGVAKDETGTKVPVLKVGMTAVAAMTAATGVVHVVTARAGAAVRVGRTKPVAVSRVNVKRVASIATPRAARPAASTAMASAGTKGHVVSLAASIVTALVVTKGRAVSLVDSTATRAGGNPQAQSAAPTKGNAATRAARAAPIKAAASTRMGAVIVEATLTAVTQRRRTRDFHPTISGTGSKAPIPTAMGRTVIARSVAANGVAGVDADAVDAAVVAAARVEIAREDHLRVDSRKAAGQRTRSPRRLHRCRRPTVTNMVGAKANTTVVVARGASSRPNVM